MNRNNGQSGFTYIGILVTVLIIGLVMGMTGDVWSRKIYSQKERQLLFVGQAYADAINSYYEYSPISQKQLPKKIDDLLLDKRTATLKRHLRKRYLDPLTASHDWGLIKKDGALIGVYSQSMREPIKKANFLTEFRFFEQAKSYQEWKFVPESIRDSTMFK